MFKKFKKYYLSIISLTSLVLLACLIFIVFSLSELSLLRTLVYLLPQQDLGGKNILAYGIDETKDSKRADSIMLFHINKNIKHIGVISIPRDTLVSIPEIGQTKINHTYAYHGVNLLKETISNMIGLPIDHHVEINLAQIKEIVDVIGGVSIDVKQDLYYRDLAGGINIDIRKGLQVLDGENTVNFLRFRQDKQGDIGRINRQQSFLQSFGEKLLNTSNIFKLPSLIKALNKLTKTDLSTLEMITVAKTLIDGLKEQYIHKTVIPGNIKKINGISYWTINHDKLEERIESEFLGFKMQEKIDLENATYNLIKDLEENLSNHENTIENLNQKMNLLSSQNKAYVQQIEDLEQDKMQSKDMINDFKNNQQTMQINLDSIKEKNSLQAIQIQELNKYTNELAVRKNEIEELNQKNIEIISNLKNNEINLKESLTAQNLKIKELEQNNAKLTQSISTNESTIAMLEKRNLLQKDRIKIEPALQEDKLIISKPFKGLTIEILNGCGEKGIAQKFAKEIKNQEMIVTRIENAGHFNYKETKLVDWKGNNTKTNKLAKKLNILPQNIIKYNRKEKNLEFTLVIGHNWK